MAVDAPVVRDLGRRPLPDVWAEMQAFTAERGPATRDEIWFLEHPPVYTLGMRADRTHLLAPRDVPVVQIDRGGQVTYHGPGQLVTYVLLDLERLELTPRKLVMALENAVVDTVADYGVQAAARRDAPGVYVNGAKIAAVGQPDLRGHRAGGRGRIPSDHDRADARFFEPLHDVADARTDRIGKAGETDPGKPFRRDHLGPADELVISKTQHPQRPARHLPVDLLDGFPVFR